MICSILQERQQEREAKIVKLKELGFQVSKEGVIAYKTFGCEYDPPETWRIRKGSILESECNHNEDEDCGFGINVATLEWVENNYGSTNEGYDAKTDKYIYEYRNIWKVLIKHEWLDGVCIPSKMYDDSDLGKIRCERVLLVDYLKGDHPSRKKIRKSLQLAEFEN